MGKNRGSKEQNVREKQPEKPLLMSSWRVTQKKKKTSPQRVVFVNNCIVFKVQEFLYKKYSCVGLSTPKKTEEQKKGTNSGEEREKRKAKYRTEREFTERRG